MRSTKVQPGPVLSRRAQQHDRLVATRVRERRIALGLSQAQLAEAIGVTYQQLHKYEVGTSRIAAGRLFDFAQALKTPIAFFFADLALDGAAVAQSRRLLELVRIFEGLSTEQQALLLNMTAALAQERGRAVSPPSIADPSSAPDESDRQLLSPP